MVTHFRTKLKQLRGKKTQKVFSEELGMKLSNYSKIETGRSTPTVKTLERIAKLTNFTLIIDFIPNDIDTTETDIKNSNKE